MSVTQTMQAFQSILENEVPILAKETGAVKRQRKDGLDSVTFVMTLIFGFWQIPDVRLSGLAQMMGRRLVKVTASAICQRFSAQAASLLRLVLQRFTQVHLQGEKVQTALLNHFSAVIVEDSSTITLPEKLAGIWKGCGGSHGASGAAVKLFVRWNVLTGQIQGPELTDARLNDHRSPFSVDDVPAGSLYLADLGFFGIRRLQALARGQKGKRFFATRWQPKTTLYTRSGHRIHLKGILPQQVGQVRELGVVLGKRDRLALRLILVKVPQEVADERRKRMSQAAQDHARQPSDEVLFLADWSIVLTNIPTRMADFSEVLVLLRLRWQIERLFRLWKEDGKIDEWRSKKPDRILCELYAKVCAMVMQQALIQEGCWLDPYRSIVKAASCLRHEINRVMCAFGDGQLHPTIQSILFCLKSECRLDRRAAYPSTAQLLLDGLDWQLEVLLA